MKPLTERVERFRYDIIHSRCYLFHINIPPSIPFRIPLLVIIVNPPTKLFRPLSYSRHLTYEILAWAVIPVLLEREIGLTFLHWN